MSDTTRKYWGVKAAQEFVRRMLGMQQAIKENAGAVETLRGDTSVIASDLYAKTEQNRVSAGEARERADEANAAAAGADTRARRAQETADEARRGVDGLSQVAAAAYRPNLLAATERQTVQGPARFYFDEAPEGFERGDVFTVSAAGLRRVEGNSEGFGMCIEAELPDGSNTAVTGTASIDGAGTVTLRVTTGCKGIRNAWLLMFAGDGWLEGFANTVEYTRVMMVRGELPAPWSPAPSEVAAPSVIRSKADRSELSNVLAEPSQQAVESIEQSIVANALRKNQQTLTPQEQEQVRRNLAISKTELFDDMWRQSAGEWGDIDHTHIENGIPSPYMCNDIWMGYDEALLSLLLCIGWHKRVAGAAAKGRLGGGQKIRTPLPIYYSAGDGQMDFGGLAQSNRTIEAVRFVPNAPNNKTVSLSYAFYGCSSLHTISGTIYLDSRVDTNNTFRGCSALVTVYISYLAKSLSLSDSPLLSLASLQYLVDNAANTSAITVTVHPTVYAKLTDTANAEWHKVLADAAEKNIAFATTA